MSVTIQWCDGPRPSVSRPSHTAWVASACWAIAIGWRVWIGITAVPSSTRVVAWPISTIAVSASKSSGIWGTQIEVKPAVSASIASRARRADLVAGAAAFRADHQSDPHLAPFRDSPDRGAPSGETLPARERGRQ